MNIKNIKLNKESFLLNPINWVITFSSLFLTWLAIHNHLINEDGILYLQVAEDFLKNGFTSAAQMFAWPFYPILIALISKTLKIKLITSTYAINTILQLIIVFSFLSIFKKFNPTNRQYFFAVCTIILFPQLNEYRSLIVRDFGYWAFSLIGINNLMCYSIACQNKNLAYDKIWYITCFYTAFFTAFLFRTEALLLLAALPLGLLFNRHISYKNLIAIYIPGIVVSIILALSCLVLIDSHKLSSFVNYGAKLDVFKFLAHTYHAKLEVVNKQLFPMTHNNFLGNLLFLWLGLFAIFVNKFITMFTLVNTVFLICFTFFYLRQHNNQHFKLIAFSGLMTLLIPTAFLYLVFVISGRYYLLSTLLFLLFVPFGADYLFEKILQNKKYHQVLSYSFVLIFPIILLGINLDSLTVFGNDKTYIKQAGVWYKQNILPMDLAASNNNQLRYYADLPPSALAEIQADKLLESSYEYTLLKIGRKDHTNLDLISDLSNQNKIIVLQKFINKKHDVIFIIKKAPVINQTFII